MKLFGIPFGGNDNAQQRGEVAADMLAAQGDTDETTNYRMIRQIAEENHLDSIDFGMAVQNRLQGNTWCPNCRCTQPAQHVCFD